MISVIVYGRNDSHGYNLPKRAALSFNCIAEVLTQQDDEIIFVDCNTPDDMPTFPESIADTLTPRAKQLLRILRLRPSQYEKGKNGTKFKVLEPLCRNVAIRRSNPRNRWILNTNTDMVFVPLAPGKSLSDVAAKLPDGFYELPRFEMPEILWETTDRGQPKAIIESFKHWGRRLHVNEVVANMKEILFDGPGDFQLALRKQMFAIHGMNEQMVLGWHVDSNLCKRMFLLNGVTKSLLDQVYAYHCDHTRLNTVYHSATESTANDYRVFFNDVATSGLPVQAQTWGLPKEEIEEVRLTEEYSGRYAKVLEGLLPGLSVPMLKSALMGESFNHGLLYDNQHILPYITDHLTMIPPTATVGYFGDNIELLRLIAEFRREYGHSGRLLFDESLMVSAQRPELSSLPSECVPVDQKQLFEQAFVYCFDLSMKTFPQMVNGAGFAVPKPSVAAGAHAALLLRRFVDCARQEKQKLDKGASLTRKFLFFGSHNTWFESATTQLIGVVLTPYSSYVRHGFIRTDAFTKPFQAVFGHHLLIADSFNERFEWLAQEVARPVTLLEYCLAEMRLKAAAEVMEKAGTETTEFAKAAAVSSPLARAVLQLETAIAETDGLFDKADQLRNLQAALEQRTWPRSQSGADALGSPLVAPNKFAPALSESVTRLNSPTIGVDARTLYYADSNARGVGHYALHHLFHAARLKSDWQFVLFGDSATPTAAIERLLKLPNIRQKLLSEYQPGEIDLWHIPDPLMLKPGFGSPMELMPEVRSSVIFYDLIGLRFYWGAWKEPVRREYLERLEQMLNPRFEVLAISEFTRQDLIVTTAIDNQKVRTILAGLNQSDNPAPLEPATLRAVNHKYGITKPFFLHVGALDPHKNFETVVKALAQVRPQGSAQLVVVGEKDHYMKQIADFVAEMKMQDIIFTGFIPRPDLEALYQSAISLVFLSRHEGFGFPVLEAMAHGCPVITTKVTSIPEVAGNAALLFGPDDVSGIGRGMQELLNQPQRRAALREKGHLQAAQFSWDKTARKTIALWQEMLGLPIDEPPAVPGPTPTSTVPVSRPRPTEESLAIEMPDPVEMAPTVNCKGISGNSALELTWFAPWQNPSGYCSEALAFAQGLAPSVKLNLIDVAKTKSPSFVGGLPSELRQLLQDHLRLQVDVAGKVCLSHMPGSSFAPQTGAAYCIGRTMFETDRLPLSWVTKCNQMDEIWVPSRFNLETFAASGVERDKLMVIPGAVDHRFFDPALHAPLPLPNRAAFNFLSIFEWSSRKGWDVLLAAYLREFSADDDVCLYLRAYQLNQPDGNPKEIISRLIQEYAATLDLGKKSWPRIEILAEQISTLDFPQLYKAVDCLVAPSRGEGWGRPQHEAMMMGLPVIATNWSGNTEFMNAENSYLLNYELREIRQTEAALWHYRGQTWANPSQEHLRELMRHVQQNPAEAAARGRKARSHVEQFFSCEGVAKQISDRLQAIEKKLSTAACPAALTKPLKVAAELPNQKPQPINVSWEGSFLDLGSLSHVNRELTRQLARQNNLQLACVGKNTLPPNWAHIPALKDMARRLRAQGPKQAQVTVRHAWPPDWNRPASGAWVLIQPWEFGVLPLDWTKELANVDEVWVPSTYVRRVYVDSGIDPQKVKVVPNGIDPVIFRPDAAACTLATQKSFKFLFVGGTIHRKGPDLLLRAYLENFTAADDVCLVIKDFGGQSAYAGQTLEAQIRALQSRPDAPEILYLNDELSPEDLPALYTACDCLVHPYRGEGFGLPILEAMACGLPVLVTAGGASDDFATDEYAYRIPALRLLISPEVGGLKLVRNGWWLEPDHAALGDQMRWVRAHPEEARLKGHAASDYVRREWTWERAAQIAAQRLQDLVTRERVQIETIRQRRSIKASPIVLPAAAKVGQLEEARYLLKKKDFLAAWKNAASALTVRPFHPEAYLLLGNIAREAGDFEQAKRCGNLARSLCPSWKPAQQLLKALSSQDRGKSVEWLVLPTIPTSPRVSICLITKNEERFLGDCLKSVREIAHQIVVLDTGSTDRTIEIAKQYSAEVHSCVWRDDFGTARNAALEHCTGDWILMLDADEELTPEGRLQLLNELKAPAVIAYRLPIVDKGREEEGCSYVPRLFRNAPGLFFVGRVHEQIFSSVEVRRKEWGLENRRGATKLLHHGYIAEVVQGRNKTERNLRLLELATEELPNEPNLLMNLGLELVRSGQMEAGLEYYWEAFHLLSILPPQEIVPELRETLLTQLCSHLMGAKQFEEMIQLLHSPFASADLTASLHFLLGLASLELRQYGEAAEQMRQCLAKRDHPALSPINKDIRKGAPQHCLAVCLAKTNRPSEAQEAFRAALAEEPMSRAVRFDYAAFQAEQGEPLEALKILHELVGENSDHLSAWQAGGQIALSSPDFIEFACDWTGESVKHFPENLSLLRQRAEALLCSGNAIEALPLWQKLSAAQNPLSLAALVICEVVNDITGRTLPSAQEPALSQEFLKWYRRLLGAENTKLVHELNGRLKSLKRILPSAATILEAAVLDAKETPVA